MTSTTQTNLGHPIAVFVTRLRSTLDSLADVPAWSASSTELRTSVVELARARAQLDELSLRVLAAADRLKVAAETAATSTAAWVAAATRRPPGAAAADVALAAALDGDLVATRAELAAGGVDLEQARVVVAAVQALPEDAVTEDPSCPARAESALLELARTHDARRLKQLGRHVLHVLDPEAADRRLGWQLEREEREAARVTFFELHDNGDGTHGGRFRISDLHAAMLTKMLDAISNPARQATGTTGTNRPDGADAVGPVRVPRPERRGQALCELLGRMPANRLPTSGGVSAMTVVHLDYDALISGLGTARLDTGEQISAALARRLACEAGVIPAVVRRLVDGGSVVLDLGRKRRLHTEAMRIVLSIEQGGCTAEHCRRPAGWCQAHHDLSWSGGGATSVANGRLLCSFHHHKAHSSSYATERIPGNRLRFHRRT